VSALIGQQAALPGTSYFAAVKFDAAAQSVVDPLVSFTMQLQPLVQAASSTIASRIRRVHKSSAVAALPRTACTSRPNDSVSANLGNYLFRNPGRQRASFLAE